MNFTNSEVRAFAREKLKENWFNGAVITLIVFVISGIVSALTFAWQDLFFWGLIIDIAIMVVMLPLTVSLAFVYLSFVRGETLEFQKLAFAYKGDMFKKSFLLVLLTSVFTFLWSLLLIIPGIVKAISYSFAPYVLVDNPSYDWRQCLDESKKLTNGYKGQLFLLALSFIGWALLSVLTLGIGYLFLQPYIQTSYANFYDRRKFDVYGAPEFEQAGLE